MISAGGSFNGMVRSNKTAGEIIDMLATPTTREAIVEAMLEKYDAPREVIERDVDKVISALSEIGAIDD